MTKTVKVRVAVTVDASGDWCASGWKGGDDDEVMDSAAGSIGDNEACFWLEAELPVPEVPTITATVTEAK